MASKKKSCVLDDVDELIRSTPNHIDEVLLKLRETCQEHISNAEQEAITIVTEAAQRTERMKKEIANWEEEKKQRTTALDTELEERDADHTKEARKRIEAMYTEAEKRIEAMKAEHADAINKEMAAWEKEKKQQTKTTKKEIEDWEEEKKQIASKHNFEPMVKLDVGGITFTTATATLTRFPNTMLGAMFSGRHALQPDQHGAYCIDRDGTHFHEILNFLRGTTTSTQKHIEQRVSPEAIEELKVEADFYGVKGIIFPPKVLVRITGATGIKAAMCMIDINGVYEAITVLPGDMPVYVKKDCWFGDNWLEYHAPSKSWQVKSTPNKGTETCYAACVVPDKCLPQECPQGKWKASLVGNKWEDQSAITVTDIDNK